MNPNLKTLTRVERERVTDSVLKIQSARHSLEQVDEGKIPSQEEIEACLDNADQNLRTALGYKKDKSKN
jgi:hypothetical protein